MYSPMIYFFIQGYSHSCEFSAELQSILLLYYSLWILPSSLELTYLFLHCW